MHCTSQSLLRGAFSAALRQPSTASPPAFLIPFVVQQSSSFSTTAALQKRKRHLRDRNPARGQSALRHTGLKNQKLTTVKLEDLPEPVLDPRRRSEVEVDPDHGLWGFFNEEREVLQTPVAVNAHGRAWSVAELRLRDWDDLHKLWWVCVKEINRMNTMEAERKRLKAGHGEYEATTRIDTVRTTMKRIKFTLTERWYAWEEARWDAMADPAIDMYAEDGQNAYDPSRDVAEAEDAFEKAEVASESDSQTRGSVNVPPGETRPSTGQETRV